MRFFLAFVFLFSSVFPSLAAVCPTGKQQAGFQLIEFRDQIMVIAVSCGKQKEYNRFVSRFRSTLQGANKQMVGYFSLSSDASLTYDRYMTHLANMHSQIALKDGDEFCGKQQDLLQKLSALKTAKDLSLIAERSIRVRPEEILSCRS